MRPVEAHALTRRFGKILALRDLNLEIEEGSAYALMGPNGAGKSTLIKILMNLISPTSGTARLLGMDAGTLRGRHLEQIGYVSENQKLPEWMTVEQYLSYCRPFYPGWRVDLEHRLCARFDLNKQQRLNRLSRGLRMKVALTSVLAFQPRLLILDEPLSGLDPLVRDELLEGLNETKEKTTILISSHDLAEIDSFASHVGYLDGGQLLLSTTMAELRQRFRRVAATFEAPASWRVEGIFKGQAETPGKRPTEWMNFTPTSTGASWVEAEYDEDLSVRRATAVFPGAKIIATPLSLREVFLAMAHAERQAKGGTQ